MGYLYSLMLWLLLPYIFLRLWWRARKQPEYLHHIGERFGFYRPRSDKPVIWLHAVSVGETRAAQSLIGRLQRDYPRYQILLTHTTPTGRTTGQQLYGDSVVCAYLPYDYSFATNRFLRHFRPQLGILMETEIWFNLIRACKRQGMPLLLLNARLSEKSARSYARFARLSDEALNNLTSIAAQTAEDAFRFTGLGANNVSVMGNLKFDIDPPVALLDLGKHFREQCGAARNVFLAASSRECEELLILDALQKKAFANALLVIVPRHPQRFSEIEDLLKQRKIRYQCRSKNQPVSNEIQVWLGDSMGEMFAYYACADVAFIGGSLLPYGGQNLIEACAVGTPVIVGPHTYNFTDATHRAIKAGAAIRISDADTLVERLTALLMNPDELSKMRQQALTFVNENRGATEKAMRIIASSLPLSSK
jgi:3-deoxy-D-manno-octulosonic-acid transferase